MRQDARSSMSTYMDQIIPKRQPALAQVDVWKGSAVLLYCFLKKTERTVFNCKTVQQHILAFLYFSRDFMRHMFENVAIMRHMFDMPSDCVCFSEKLNYHPPH